MVKTKTLGASLYVPASHKALGHIANGELLSNLRSVIFCTEDAVADRDLNYALFNLSLTLPQMIERPGMERFVRVLSADVMARVLEIPGSGRVEGFGVSKATRDNFNAYFRPVRKTRHRLIPRL